MCHKTKTKDVISVLFLVSSHMQTLLKREASQLQAKTTTRNKVNNDNRYFLSYDYVSCFVLNYAVNCLTEMQTKLELFCHAYI